MKREKHALSASKRLNIQQKLELTRVLISTAMIALKSGLTSARIAVQTARKSFKRSSEETILGMTSRLQLLKRSIQEPFVSNVSIQKFNTKIFVIVAKSSLNYATYVMRNSKKMDIPYVNIV